MKYVVSISGGLGSAEALKRTIDQHGRDNVLAVFCDVKGRGDRHIFSRFPVVDGLLHERFGGESHDTYRFLFQLSHHLGISIERLETDDSIWNVFARRKALLLVLSGGVFFCPASEELKRWQFRDYVQRIAGNITIVLGMGWDEPHRVKSSASYWSKALERDVQVIAPNAIQPYADNTTTLSWLREAGVEPPSAYAAGMLHNNCYGGCVMQGLTGFARLHDTRPDVFWYWAWMEKRLQDWIGKGYTILKDQRGGSTTPLNLYDFAERIQAGDVPKFDYGGCGCFANSEMLEFLSQCEIKPTSRPATVQVNVAGVAQPVQLKLAI